MIHGSISRLIRAAAVPLATIAFAGAAMYAGPIITPIGSTSSSRAAVTNAQFLGLPFTLTSAFSDVTIDASLTARDAGVPGTAYLTNQIGPGTTLANELATVAFTFVQEASIGTLAYQTLFSGLNLGPGTYYLVLSSSTIGHVQGIDAGATGYTVDPDASPGAEISSSGGSLNAGFPPASTFSPPPAPDFFFSVSSTPEPGTYFVGVALAGFVMLRLRARPAAR